LTGLAPVDPETWHWPHKSLIRWDNDARSNHPRLYKSSGTGIYQIVINTFSGFDYLCQQLAYLVLSNIFLIARQIVKFLGSYQEYPAKSEGKQNGEEFFIVVLVKSKQDSLSDI
jgi:hypothetical protein